MATGAEQAASPLQQRCCQSACSMTRLPRMLAAVGAAWEQHVSTHGTRYAAALQQSALLRSKVPVTHHCSAMCMRQG